MITPFIHTTEGMPDDRQKEFGVKEYRPNYDYFQEWEHGHRHHQVAALSNFHGQTIGQICLPTATGKTRVQVAIHVATMIEMQKVNQQGVFVIGAHRLALCTQLLEQLVEVAVKSGIKFDILFIGSAQFPEDKVHAKFADQGFNAYVNNAVSTTKQVDVRNAVRDARLRGRHVICVSTYHSFDKLDILDHITICTYDEAHTLVGETDSGDGAEYKNFLNNIIKVRPKIGRNFFFTATRRVRGESHGMNDKMLFGEVLYSEPPRKLINAGEIVPPLFHIVRTVEQGDYDNHTMLIRTITEGYAQHRRFVKTGAKEHAACLGAKLLITTTGNKEMFEIHNDAYIRQFCHDRNINMFAYSAEHGAFVNFKPRSRYEAMETMCGMKDEEDAIMIHIDILTEGIDLPSITGVMPFRELNKIKLLQTIGRSARLLKVDRRLLYAIPEEETLAGNVPWNDYVKPACWVIFPELFRSLGNADAMRDTIKTIIQEYEVPIEDYSVTDKYEADGNDDVDRITPFDHAKAKKDKESELTFIMEEIMVEQFEQVLATYNNALGALGNALAQGIENA